MSERERVHRPGDRRPADLLRDLLVAAEVTGPVTFRNLTVCGLRVPPGLGGEDAAYATLDEGIERGWIEVEETSEGGRVPELRVRHRGERPVLALDGEEVVGAKQNRILNATIVVLPGREVVIPVSCVEAGRWAYASRRFRSGGTALYASLRAAKAAQVEESLRAGRGFLADQGAIWDGIAAMSQSLGVDSPTGAMHDLYEAHRTALAAFLDALRPGADWSGAVFLVGEAAAGAEILPSPDLLRRQWRKLVLSHALEALRLPESAATRDRERAAAHPAEAGEHPGGAAEHRAQGPDRRAEAARFLDLAAAAERSERPSVGDGVDVRLRGDGLVGAALVREGHVAHASLFAAGGAHPGRDRGEG